MELHVGLDVALESTSVCIVDGTGGKVLETTALSEPEAICIAIRPHVADIVRIGIEASAIGMWLARELKAEGLPVTVVETRHMRSALSAMRNKTDRNDAHGIAQMMRMGWFRSVHVKPVETQRLKTFLANRRLLKRKLIDLQNHIRGALRVHGLKVGTVAAGRFDGRVRELIEDHGDYLFRTMIESMLEVRAVLFESFGKLHRMLLLIVKHDEVCRRLMTVPGVGPVAALSFRVSIDDPHRFSRSRTVGAHLGLTPRRYQSGTSVDWGGRISRMGDVDARAALAADHAGTAHPHTHVILRGKDGRGENLVIAPEYIAHGMRERVCELVSLDLGPVTGREIEDRQRLEVGAERFTGLDRRLLRARDEAGVVVAGGGTLFEQALRAGRLRKLEALGLTENLGAGRWRLDEELEGKLRDLGERGDIVRTMQRALNGARLERAPARQAVFAPGAGETLVGRVIARGLADEHRDRHYLVVDGLDGRAHYAAIGAAGAVEPLPDGAVVRLSAVHAGVRESDRTIAAVAAASGGRYDAARHRRHDPVASPAFVAAHVRRLEALRRGMRLERDADGTWSIRAIVNRDLVLRPWGE